MIHRQYSRVPDMPRALGGKLVGAGGGGFLLFYTEDKQRLRHAMLGAGLREVVFRFDFEGTKVILSG